MANARAPWATCLSQTLYEPSDMHTTPQKPPCLAENVLELVDHWNQ